MVVGGRGVVGESGLIYQHRVKRGGDRGAAVAEGWGDGG